MATNTIYILQLQHGKYYVGRTTDLTRRLQHHREGKGSAWTTLHPMIRLERSIPNASVYDEDRYVKEYMGKHGIDHVRGGTYSSIELDEVQYYILQQELRGAADQCLRCGRSGHFASSCYAKTDIDGDTLDSEEEEEKPSLSVQTTIYNPNSYRVRWQCDCGTVNGRSRARCTTCDGPYCLRLAPPRQNKSMCIPSHAKKEEKSSQTTSSNNNNFILRSLDSIDVDNFKKVQEYTDTIQNCLYRSRWRCECGIMNGNDRISCIQCKKVHTEVARSIANKITQGQKTVIADNWRCSCNALNSGIREECFRCHGTKTDKTC